MLSNSARLRPPWALLLAVTLGLLGGALLMQHVAGLPPCVLCIYQRVAIAGIAGVIIFPLMAPTYTPFRLCGIVGVTYCAARGVAISWEQSERYIHPENFSACDFKARFPSLLPLDEWFPAMFKAYAFCGEEVGNILEVLMPLVMLLIFSLYLLGGLLTLLSQISCNKK